MLSDISSLWDGHVVTRSNRWVSSWYSNYILPKDHTNANFDGDENDGLKLYYKIQILSAITQTINIKRAM